MTVEQEKSLLELERFREMYKLWFG